MTKFKYLRGGKVFESTKQYNLPQIGADGKLVTPKKVTNQITKPVTKPKFVTKAPYKPWDDPSRFWDESNYIDDAGNVKPNPSMTAASQKSFVAPTLPVAKQSSTYVAPKPIKKKFNIGGVDPLAKPVVTPGPKYIPINPNTTLEQNQLKAKTNLNTAVRFKSLLTGANQNLIPIDKYTQFSGGASVADQGFRQDTGFQTFSPQTIQQADSTINASRQYLGMPQKKFDTGGADFLKDMFKKRNPNQNPSISDQLGGKPNATGTDRMSISSADASSAPQATSSQADSGPSFAQAAPFFDNFANLIATKNTPNIPTPTYTSAPRLNTEVNINPQKRRIENDVKAAQTGIDRSTSSAGVANANKGKLMSEKWKAYGDLEANKFNTESQLKNQQAYADYDARRSNDQLTNQKNTMQMMRTDDVNSRYANVVGDFGNDIANINREKNLMSKDRESLKMLMKINPDSAYQFADTDTFADLYKNDEPGLIKLIKSQKGTETKASLVKLYTKLYNKQYAD